MLVIAAGAAQAQTKSSAPAAPEVPASLPAFSTETIVTAERDPQRATDVPAATTVLDRQDAAELPVQTVSELLEEVPGIRVLFSNTFAATPMVSARGFFGGGEADYVRLMVDGVPVADLESGAADWGILRSEAVDRIEVLRGPASSYYGDTAVGGVVQVFTRSSTPPRGSLNASAGTFATGAIDGSYGATLRRVDLFVSGGATRTDGARTHSAARKRTLAVMSHFGTRVGDWTLRGGGDASNVEDAGARTAQEMSLDPSGSHSFFQNDFDDRQRIRFSVGHQIARGVLGVRSIAYVAGRDGERIRTLLLAPGLPDSKFRDLSSHELGFLADGHVLWDAGRLASRFGAEMASESLDGSYSTVTSQGLRGTSLTSNAVDRRRLAVFGSQAWWPASRVRLVAGLRWDRIDDTADAATAMVHEAWSPRAGITVHVGPDRGVALFSNVSRAFKTGTLDQLFDPRPFPDFRGGTFTVSNAMLRPQRVSSVEAGASGSRPRYSWSAVVYRLSATDEIDFDPATFSYGNIGRSLHRGVETEVRLFPGAWLSPSASYAWTRVEPRTGETPGRQLKNIPTHLVRAGVRARLPASIAAALTYTRTAGAYADDAGAFLLAAGDVLSVRAAWQVAGARVYVDVLNATDDRFAEYGYTLSDFTGRVVPYYVPAAGRSVRSGLVWEF